MRLSLIACLLLGANGISAVISDTLDSKVQVHIPQSLSKDHGYDHRKALFGFPPYGGSLAQPVYYADDTLCDPNVNTTKGYPSRGIGYDGKMRPWPSPFILMVDRGDCSFVKKVRNAQHAGAAAVIIADNACLCSDKECVQAAGGWACEISEPIMADDGSGSDISIPSFLLFKQDADKIKEELKQDRAVQIEMQWSLPTPDDRVEYDLWTTPTDDVSQEFLYNFKEVAMALGKSAYFTPHMYIHDGTKLGCGGTDGENNCYTLCTNNGRYCATANGLETGILGEDVIKESLRRICIWKYYGEQDGVGVQWWDYLIEFTYRCDYKNFFMNEDCIRDAYKHSGVDGERIARCMKDSGGLLSDSSNVFLDLEIAAQYERGVVVLPTASINNVAQREPLTVNNVFKAICAQFTAEKLPPICKACMNCGDPEACVKSSGSCDACTAAAATAEDKNGGAFPLIFKIIIVISFAVWVVLLIRLVYHHGTCKSKNQESDDATEYIPVETEQEDIGSTM